MKNDLMMTDEQVEAEISRLNKTKEVQIARKETRLKYKRRQTLYQLRVLEKRGRVLLSEGYTMDNIEERMFGAESEVEDAEN